MKTRIYKAILTALLILAMAGSAMCIPDMDRVASHEEQKAIDAIQKAIDTKGYNWTAGVTSVSGLTDDEKKKLCGVKPINDQKDKDVKEKKPKKTDPVGTYPSTFDWRNVNGKDWMTPVKSQGGCGSCWAFATLGVIEAAFNIYTNNPDLDLDLSEQHLVSDCCEGDCSGGYPSDAFVYAENNGISRECCFPYTASNCACTPCANWTDANHAIVRKYANSHSKGGITEYGPMSAVICVYTDLYSYTGGVYEHVWGNFRGYHAITVVGWNDTEECWIIKNSWGADWGEDGYGRIPDEYFPSMYGAYAVESIVIPMCPSDLNYDGTVDICDINIVMAEWGQCGTRSDISGPSYGVLDGTVDVYDVAYVIDNWGDC